MDSSDSLVESSSMEQLTDETRYCNDGSNESSDSLTLADSPNDVIEVPCNVEPEQDETTPEVPLKLLSPDHPLLVKYQSSLREYLLRTKEKLVNDIEDLKYQKKQKEQQRDERGAKLYDMQEDIRQQREQLDAYAAEIQELLEKRKAEEEGVNKLKSVFDDKTAFYKERKNLYNKRMSELEHLQTLENNIKKWTAEVDDEVRNAKCVVSRDAQLQKQISEDQKRSDMVFLHLTLEVKKREQELQTIKEEMISLRETNKALNASISDAGTDLEVLQDEQKRLTQAWSQVILGISHRDKVLYQLNTEKDKCKESIKLSVNGMDAAKKQITKELKLNQKLEIFKNRLNDDLSLLRRECVKQSDILNGLEQSLNDLPLILKQSRKDLVESQREGNQIEVELRKIQFKITQQYNVKFNIEENILKIAQDQLITDKANQYRLKLLKNSQDQRRKLDYALTQVENQLADVLLDLEKHKGSIIRLRQERDKNAERLKIKEKDCDQLQAEMKSMESQIELKTKCVEKYTKQLDVILQANEGLGISPTEYKIKTMEKSIQAAEHQIREHQQFWLMLQNHYVNLSQKRNYQQNEIQVTRKQLAIIKQKTLKINYDLEKSEVETRELNQQIKMLMSKIAILNRKVFDTTHKHEINEAECANAHSELVNKLKESEMKILESEAEIKELEVEVEQYKDQVLEKHSEALAWESKYKAVEETLRWRKDESGSNSEIGIMKTEIHHMQIRHSQLKRAQEKLLQDFNHCVMHRENIFNTGTIKRHLEMAPKRNKTNTTIQQKVVNLRNKLKQIQTETAYLENEKLVEMKRVLDELKTDVRKTNKLIIQEITEYNRIQMEIEEGILLKHRNLEAIIRKQNRAKSYSRLTASTAPSVMGTIAQPKLIRSETALQVQTEKQTEINDNLFEVLQTIRAEFSGKKLFLQKLMQILRD